MDVLMSDGCRASTPENLISALPDTIQRELISTDNLFEGYVFAIPENAKLEESLRTTTRQNLDQLLEIKTLIKRYNELDDDIKQRVQKLDELYKEYLTHETIQYQYLSSNFNQDSLKSKLVRSLAEEQKELLNMLRLSKASNDDMTIYVLNDFRSKRKQLHLKREKIYRWNEERVGGFL